MHSFPKISRSVKAHAAAASIAAPSRNTNRGAGHKKRNKQRRERAPGRRENMIGYGPHIRSLAFRSKVDSWNAYFKSTVQIDFSFSLSNRSSYPTDLEYLQRANILHPGLLKVTILWNSGMEAWTLDWVPQIWYQFRSLVPIPIQIINGSIPPHCSFTLEHSTAKANEIRRNFVGGKNLSSTDRAFRCIFGGLSAAAADFTFTLFCQKYLPPVFPSAIYGAVWSGCRAFSSASERFLVLVVSILSLQY